MSDPNTGRETTVTIKTDKGHDASWFVFRGSPAAVAEQIGETFSLTPGEYDNLHELTTEATRIAQATGAAAKGVGGRVIKTTDKQGETSAPAEDKAPEDPLPGLIAACTSRAALKTLWAENKDRFAADAPLMDAWKARGKELPA